MKSPKYATVVAGALAIADAAVPAFTHDNREPRPTPRRTSPYGLTYRSDPSSVLSPLGPSAVRGRTQAGARRGVDTVPRRPQPMVSH